uniref:Uncharacterized protein n=1 Tax=Octopus bimaculoides TaxID=37653 RepID=A0A0L8HMM3_OCTBM
MWRRKEKETPGEINRKVLEQSRSYLNGSEWYKLSLAERTMILLEFKKGTFKPMPSRQKLCLETWSASFAHHRKGKIYTK